MLIATLKFILPEEREGFELAQKAGLYHSLLWDVRKYARQLRKYDERETLDKQEVIDQLHKLLTEFD
jgi:hypothetical protein